MKTLNIIIFSLITLFCDSGCAIHARYNNAQRLMQRSDWEQARDAAPEWCRDALKTINALEFELER